MRPFSTTTVTSFISASSEDVVPELRKRPLMYRRKCRVAVIGGSPIFALLWFLVCGRGNLAAVKCVSVAAARTKPTQSSSGSHHKRLADHDGETMPTTTMAARSAIEKIPSSVLRHVAWLLLCMRACSSCTTSGAAGGNSTSARHHQRAV